MVKRIYLDHAATTCIAPEVLEAMLPYLSDKFGNPSSRHYFGRESKIALDKGRNVVAETLNCKPKEIIFTSGGTESNNLAIFGTARLNPNSHIISTEIEHSSVLEPLKQLEKENHHITYLKVDHEGFIDTEELEKSINPNTKLITIIHANNEIGTTQDVEKIAKISHKNDIPLHIDSCQAATSIKLDTKELGINLMTLNGSKIYGPKGVGILYIKEKTPLQPLIFGGGQEQNFRSGTENIAYIVGFAKALELGQSEIEKENSRLKKLNNLFTEEILKIPRIKLNGPEVNSGKRLPNNINITIPDVNGNELLLFLDEEKIAASTGSACDANSDKPSHVLLSIGRTAEESTNSLRFTMGKNTTEEEITYTIKTLKNLIKKLKR